jgi:hypothetical protein
MDTWMHCGSELPPEKYWPESILGTKVQLARWMSHDGKDDRRRLKTKAVNGVVWIKQHHQRLYEVFFISERDYRRAMDRKSIEDNATRNDVKLHEHT